MRFKALSSSLKYLMSACGLILFLLSGCSDNAIFEENLEITDGNWDYADTLSFDVEIDNTGRLYDVMLNVRHTSEYPNANLWLQVVTVFPSGEQDTDRLNLPMAENSGKWLGSGLGSVKSNMVLIQQYARLPETGTYTFHILQDMRRNPLTEILDIGLRIEPSPTE